MTDFEPGPVIGHIEIPRRSSPRPYQGVLFLSVGSTGGIEQ